MNTLASKQTAVSACCTMYDLELLTMDRKTVRNMVGAIPNEINLIHWCIWFVLL